MDTGAVKLHLKQSVIEQLGLRPISSVRSHSMSNRREDRRVFSPVGLEIQGRSGLYSVVEIPAALLNIVGQIPQEDLDWVVDSLAGSSRTRRTRTGRRTTSIDSFRRCHRALR